jgi:hypothetical protein
LASLTPDPVAFDADLEVVVNDPFYRHQNPHRFPLKVADGGKTLMVGPSLVNEKNCTFVQITRQLPIALAKWRTLPLCTNLWIVDRSLPRFKNNSSLFYNGAPVELWPHSLLVSPVDPADNVSRGATETGSASNPVLSSAKDPVGESTRLKMEVESFSRPSPPRRTAAIRRTKRSLGA